jgi:hypothetical protein
VHEQTNERWATLVLLTPAGELLGQLPPLRAGSPWWPEVESVVSAAREGHGLSVVVLRLLSAERSAPPGGQVTYLAEVDAAHAGAARALCSPCPLALGELLAEHPLRNPYARLGGPARDLAWADRVLLERGLVRLGPAHQIKTWNLSSLWWLPIPGGRAWLKAVPGFFGHEAALIAAMPAGAPVPRLLGHDGARCLMEDIPGEDLFHTGVDERCRMIELLVGLQRAFVGRAGELRALGLPSLAAPESSAAIRSLLERTRDELELDDARTLDVFADGLERRFAALEACGLPDGLVHGDFHSGNVRGDGSRLTLIDWGDAGVGHPLLDAPAFLGRAPEDQRLALRSHWLARWRDAAPGSEPERAWALSAPLAAARQAVNYRRFLDHIEPAEHPYHRGDPAERLRRTAELLRGEHRA